MRVRQIWAPQRRPSGPDNQRAGLAHAAEARWYFVLHVISSVNKKFCVCVCVARVVPTACSPRGLDFREAIKGRTLEGANYSYLGMSVHFTVLINLGPIKVNRLLLGH